MANVASRTIELNTRRGDAVCKHSLIAPAASRQAYTRRIREHWTPERMALATPVEAPEELPGDDGAADDSATTQVADVTQAPYASAGRLFFTTGGDDHWCTASAVGSQLVLTAAHCVFDDKADEFAENIAFMPQYTDGPTVGTFAAATIYIYAEWRTSSVLSRSRFDVDYAFFTTTEVLPVPALPIDFSPPDDEPTLALDLGYPVDKRPSYPFDGKYMWETQATAKLNLASTKWKITSALTKGCSGGPWLDSTGTIFTLNSVFGPLRKLGRQLRGPVLGPVAEALYDVATTQTASWTNPIAIGNGPTWPLIVGSNAYVSSPADGRIYQLDLETGTLVATQLLDGDGNYPVTLATDGTLIYAGVYGLLVAVAIADVAGDPLWTNRLKGAGWYSVNVLAQDGYAFAGINGYVFCVTPDGSQTLKNNAAAFGVGDTCLAADGDALYVGSNCRVTKVPLATFESAPVWSTVFPPTPDSGVSMVVISGLLCAGLDGFVRTLSVADGSIASTASSGTGPVGLVTDGVWAFAAASSSDASAAMVVAIDPVTGQAQWLTPLVSGPISAPVSIAYANGVLVVGCNGWLFALRATDGTLMSSVSLVTSPGQTAVATNGTVAIAGMNGSAFGWVIASGS